MMSVRTWDRQKLPKNNNQVRTEMNSMSHVGANEFTSIGWLSVARPCEILRKVPEMFLYSSRKLFKKWTWTALKVSKKRSSTFKEMLNWTNFKSKYS